MRALSCVFSITLLITYTYQSSLESLEDFLVYPVEISSHLQKRETWREESRKSFETFVEEKLVAQSQALEHIVKMAQSNREYLKQLVENLSSKIIDPKMPEKVEVLRQNRRNYADTKTDYPFVQIRNNIPKYGNLVKDMIFKEFQNEDDPKAFVEYSYTKADAKSSAV